MNRITPNPKRTSPIVWKCVGVICAALLLVGCAAEPRIYNSGIAKNTWVLTLNPDGTYRHAQQFMHLDEAESGQWWEIQDHVVLLLPDHSDGSVQYAHVLDKQSPFQNYWIYRDLRSALKEHDGALGLSEADLERLFDSIEPHSSGLD